MDCLPQLAMSLIVDYIVAETGPFFREFFALAGTCRAIRARCIEAARAALDPCGEWDAFTGPRVIDLKPASQDGSIQALWRAPNKDHPWSKSVGMKRAVTSSILRTHLFMRSMHGDGTRTFSLYTFARYAPRELFDDANKHGDLVKFINLYTIYDAIAARKLPFSLIPQRHAFNHEVLRNVIRADLDNRDFFLTYSRTYLHTSLLHFPFAFQPPLEILFGFPEATRHVARMFADFASDNHSLIDWQLIEVHVFNYPNEIWKLRELYMSDTIPFGGAVIANCRAHIIARLLALGIVTGAPWTRGVRALRRYFVRISGREQDPSLGIDLATYLAHECIRCHLRKPTPSKMRAMFNELAIVTKKDARFWRNVEERVAPFSMIARFIARMKRACLRKRK